MLIVTPPLFLLTTDMLCWWCAEEIAVSGLVVRDIVENEEGEEVRYGGEPDDFWTLSYIEALPDDVLAEIRHHSPRFGRSRSGTAGQEYFGNCCPHCNALQGDHYVHSEPDQAFFRTSDADLDAIRVTTLIYASTFETVANIGENSGVTELLRKHLGIADPVRNRRRRSRKG